MVSNWNPRIAVCFSGLPRLVPAATESWRRFIAGNDVDVFAHTWLTNDDDRIRITKSITDRFNPKMLKIEPLRKINIDLYKDSDRIWPYRSEPTNVLSMWTSIHESISLSRIWSMYKAVSYDVVVRARFDWWCEEIVIENNQGLTVPDSPGLSGHRFTYKGNQYIAHNDQFGYGNPTVMSHYANTIESIPRLFAFDGVDFCSELLLTANMLSSGVLINYQKNMKCGIVK